MAKGLDVTDFKSDTESHNGINHRIIVQNLAIVASAAEDPAVKTKANEYLSKYANKTGEGRGYVGQTVIPEIQQFANDAIGAISRTVKNPSQ